MTVTHTVVTEAGTGKVRVWTDAQAEGFWAIAGFDDSAWAAVKALLREWLPLMGAAIAWMVVEGE